MCVSIGFSHHDTLAWFPRDLNAMTRLCSNSAIGWGSKRVYPGAWRFLETSEFKQFEITRGMIALFPQVIDCCLLDFDLQ